LYDEDFGPESWRYKAQCKGMKTDLWFPPRDKEKYKTIAEISKAICYGKNGLPECPVRKECLLYADKMEDTHGIWGGMSHRERNSLKRKALKAGLTLEEWVNTRKS
jgi:WhiB family transcriptional regulator, redox-sensing transcriptional regulator